ncbi:hypothetical protein VTL71DRAFT_1071 [Oculimacula yallundae]|uniref:DOMON domain-containing protein n=1 Tax=Oculimacula yallundae TaxID=86028 RepID=A0ABR4D1U2_9HELO
MRWSLSARIAAAVVSLVTGVQAADSFAFKDSDTGFLFQQYNAAYKIGSSIAYRVALPSQINSTYPVIVQIAAPLEVGWAGLAWGGSMINNPLMACYANGASVTISSRYATGHSLPPVYTTPKYEILKSGTYTNRTHWKVTAKCTGCTSYIGANNKAVVLNANGNNRFAFAYSGSKPSNPASNTSSFPVHEVTNYWNHDFAAAKNADWTALLSRNGVKGDAGDGGQSGGVEGGCHV